MTLRNAQIAGQTAYKDATAGSSALVAKAQSFLTSALQRLQSESEARRAIWELQQLDDHALRDIGLNRCDIEAYVRGDRK